jgi:hypothetical protein
MAPCDATALVISEDEAGRLRFQTDNWMALGSGLHRALRAGKTRRHQDTNAASLMTLLRHIEAHSSATVRARVEQGHTHLAGDRGAGFTVRQRIARGTYVSPSLLRQIDDLYQQALSQENALAIDRFIGSTPSPEELTPWPLSARRPGPPSCGFQRLLQRLAREGTESSDADGIRIWAQSTADYGNTWAHLRDAMAPGPYRNLPDDMLQQQLAACDEALHLPAKGTRSRLLEVARDVVDGVCSFFGPCDAASSQEAHWELRRKRSELLYEKHRREFLDLLRTYLRAQVAALAGRGSYVDEGTLARMGASYLSRPAIFRSFVKAYNRQQVAELVYGENCPNAVAAMVRQCESVVDPLTRGCIDASDLLALAEGLESWTPHNDSFTLVQNHSRVASLYGNGGKRYSTFELCEAVAGALAGLVLPAPGPRPLKARLHDMKTQPRELTLTDLAWAAFPVFQPLLEERHGTVAALRAAQTGVQRARAAQIRKLVSVYPMLAQWAQRPELIADPGPSGDLMALNMAIPHTLDPIIYAERLRIQNEEAQSSERDLTALIDGKKDIAYSYYATYAPGALAGENAVSEYDEARKAARLRLDQLDLCFEAVREAMLLRITALGRERERELIEQLCARHGTLWQACEVLQDYAERVCAVDGRRVGAGDAAKDRSENEAGWHRYRLAERAKGAIAAIRTLAEQYATAAGPQLRVLMAALETIPPRLWLEQSTARPAGPSTAVATRRAMTGTGSPQTPSLWQWVRPLVRPLVGPLHDHLHAGLAALGWSARRAPELELEHRR